ncbi:MAG: hypothetical protein OEV09_12790, partial [Deltaproteobacteria bacterium]|nr:hypothetical protein [Deltaproteobacteria bacterium]
RCEREEDGRATWQPSRGTAGLVSVPERYVAGAACPERSRRNTRGRQASGSESLQLGEKDGHIRGRSK